MDYSLDNQAYDEKAGTIDFRTKYKTELCKNFELTGQCPFETSCSFAHGQQELHTKAHVPKNYKTKLCRRFHEELYCPYGPRCQFRHGENDVAQVPNTSANNAKKAQTNTATQTVTSVKQASKVV